MDTAKSRILVHSLPSIDKKPPDLPEVEDPADTAREKNVVHGALHDKRDNAVIAKDMRTNEPVVRQLKDWVPSMNDLLGWDTTDIAEHHAAFEGTFPGMKASLERDVGADAVSGRVKTLESIVKKLKRKNVNEPFTHHNLEDIIGLRITLPTIAAIDDAVRAIRENHTVQQEEDYITHPNQGYRSFHFTLSHEGKPVEVQLRTPNMTKWADWQHDRFYENADRTKALLGEAGYKDAQLYSQAMSRYYEAVDAGKSPGLPPIPPTVAKRLGGGMEAPPNLTKVEHEGTLTTSEGKGGPYRYDDDVSASHTRGLSQAGQGVSGDVSPEDLQGTEEAGRTSAVLLPQSAGSGTIRNQSDQERRMGPERLEPSRSPRDTGVGERLAPPPKPLIPGSLPTSIPRDVILTSSSDIGASAGPGARFDANLQAIRTLKLVEAADRQATPVEQAIITKYSGFGDSAFNGAFQSARARAYGNTEDAWQRRGDQLRELTTEEEYKTLERSRLNAFYTSPEVVKATWAGLQQLGADNIDHPRILEPSAGSGRFLGFQPLDMAARSHRTAVELDDLTGRMLKHTYPNTDVFVMGYEKAPIAPGSMDIAISNVPFGDYPVHDPSFRKGRKLLTRQIHNYFFAKALDHLRPGGTLAFITSHYTLDAAKAKPVREALASQADLVAAIRLPKTAFPDTEVVTDIIFMRKRQPDEQPGDTSWVDTGELELQAGEEGGYRYPVNVNVNRYFLDHPEMVLGTHSTGGSMYRRDDYTVEPKDGQLLPDAIAATVKQMPRNILTDAPKPEQSPRSDPLPSAVNLRAGARVVTSDGTVSIVRRGYLEKADMSQDEQNRVKDMLVVRDAARRALNTQLRSGSDAEVAETQKALNAVYGDFTGNHGPLNAPKNADLMRDDPDGPFLRALEQWDDATAKKLKTAAHLGPETAASLKMPIFSQRVVHGMGKLLVTSDADAIAVSLNETGRLDFKRMAALLGKSEDKVRESLSDKRLIFKNPVGDWETADKYLSGDVREKLRIAEAATSAKREYTPNVAALKVVQPADLAPSQIHVRLGAPWIPGEDVDDFVRQLLAARSWRGEPMFKYVQATGEWVKVGKVEGNYAKMESEWGTARMPADEIIKRMLNGKLIEVIDKDEDDKSVRNPQETVAAQDKAAAIQAAFKEWLWDDPERTKRLAEYYNTTFNIQHPRVFDGKHQELPGMSPEWFAKIHPHNKDAIWRVVQDRTSLLAHEVGFGKTVVMVGSGMELRRLGLAQKNLYVVPKATHAQFAKQFRDVYPYSKVLTPGQADFTPARRAEFIARVVTGDWDGVILSDSQFQRIPVRPETEAKFLRDEIATYRAALELEGEGASGDYRSVKQSKKTHKEIQKALVRLESRLQDTLAKVGERAEHTMYFEDLGIDQMFVDEADMYKNLRFVTRMGRVKGLPNTDSERAWNMYQKTRYLLQGNSQGVVFATGTPIANTIAEMYTQMRYLQEPMLEAKGLQHFDAWAKTFGETTDSLEQTPTGQYRMTQRFSKFVNAPELSNLWQQVADIRVADEVPSMVRQRPRLVDDEGLERRTVVSTPPDEALTDYMKKLAKRADELGGVDPHEDNMLKIANDARLASLDMRMVDPRAPQNPNGKVPTACRKIAELYRETEADRGTQLVFLDLGTPKAPDKTTDKDEGEGEALEETAQEEKVLRNVYGIIRERLVAAGIPNNEIAFIHDAKNDSQKVALFAKVNKGEVRVLIGSTGKLGVGVNVQERAAALHHLDAPWRPRDIEQREGRIIRQGNIVYGPKRDAAGEIVNAGPGVRVYTYVTEGSFDGYMWQAIEAKARAIKAIMRRDNPPRAVEDIDSLTMSAAEAKAVASGNPDVLKAVTIKNDVTRLQMLRASHIDAKVRAREQLLSIPGQIDNLRENIAKMGKDANLSATGGQFVMKVMGKTFSERAPAAEALRDAVAETDVTTEASDAPVVGAYKGLSLSAYNQGPGAGYGLLLHSPETGVVYTTTTIPHSELTASGLLQRIDNKIAGIPAAIDKGKQEIGRLEANLRTYQEQAAVPFEYQQRIDAMESELARLEKKLQGQEVSGESLYEIPSREEERPTPPAATPSTQLEGIAEEDATAPKQIGDAARVMNTDSILAKTERLDGVDYELYNANRLKDKRGFVRVYDAESGNTITNKEYPTFDQAEAAYSKATTAATRAESVPPAAKAPLVVTVRRVDPKPRTARQIKAREGETVVTTIGDIEQVQEGRTPLAIAIDRSRTAKRVLPSTKAGKWLRHPNRFDVRGIDTKRGSVRLGRGLVR